MFHQGEKRLGLLDTNQGTQRRQVELRTCADVYDHWRAYKRLYKNAPKSGVQFSVDYIDTGLGMEPEELAKAPICLALHGAPGSYKDFSLLINHLSRQQVRVIAPNFPEYIATVRTKTLFRHSADEKAAYLRDFLKAIKVSKIDLLVSHSSAIFPTLLILLNGSKKALEGTGNAAQQQQQQPELESEDDNDDDDDDESFKDTTSEIDGNNNSDAAKQQTKTNVRATQVEPLSSINENSTPFESARSGRRKLRKAQRRQKVLVHFEEPIEIRAVVLFNPAGHRLPKSMKPEWFKCGSCRIYQHNWGRSIFRKLGPGFLTIVGVPVRVDNMDNVMLSATVMRNSRCERMVSQLDQLAKLGLPTLLVFSENDKLIEREIFYEMAQFMKLDKSRFDIFNDDGELELAQSKPEDWIRVMVFKAGGHYAYSNYAKTVNKAVSELLARVAPGQVKQVPEEEPLQQPA